MVWADHSSRRDYSALSHGVSEPNYNVLFSLHSNRCSALQDFQEVSRPWPCSCAVHIQHEQHRSLADCSRPASDPRLTSALESSASLLSGCTSFRLEEPTLRRIFSGRHSVIRSRLAKMMGGSAPDPPRTGPLSCFGDCGPHCPKFCGLAGYRDHLKAAAQLSEACGLHRQQRLFEELLRHNVPFLRQLTPKQPVTTTPARVSHFHPLHGHQLRELRHFRAKHRRRQRKNRPAEEDPRIRSSWKNVWTPPPHRDSDVTPRQSSARGAPPVLVEETFPEAFTHVVEALKRARKANRCPHQALGVYRHLRSSLARLDCDFCSRRSEKDGGERFSGNNKESPEAARTTQPLAGPHIGQAKVCVVTRFQFAWSSVVLQTPRQNALYALFGDVLASLRHYQRPCLLNSSPGRAELNAAGSLPEENLLLQVALSSPPGCVNERDSRSSAPQEARSDTAHAEAKTGARSWPECKPLREPHGAPAPSAVPHVTGMGFAWHLLAAVYERDARTVADAPEERAFLRRAAALCHFMCLYTWPFMLASWERLVPLILSEPSSLQRISLLLRLLGSSRDHQKLPCNCASGEGYLPLSLSHLRDLLFSPAALCSSAFLRLSVGSAVEDAQWSGGGRSLSFHMRTLRQQSVPWAVRVFAFVLRSVAAVQLRMARGEARDALQLLSEWPLLPEGSRYGPRRFQVDRTVCRWRALLRNA